jgi:hypothetical protein
MKISKATLHQIIREEARSLVEAPVSRGPRGTEPMTRYAKRKGPQTRRRDKDRAAVRDMLGPDDPLVTKTSQKEPDSQEPADPDKTLKVDREEETHGRVPARHHGSDDFITTTNFNKDVLLTALQRYADENDFKVEEKPLGAGLYSIAYLAYGAEGDQVLKITAHKKEKDAYQAIMARRNAAVSEMPNAAKALPRVYDIEQVSTEPVKLRPPPSAEFPGHVPQGEWNYEPAADGKPYDLWIIRMEKLETLEEAGYGEEIRSDIFGYSGARPASPQAMLRYIKNVFSFKNFYNSLEDTLEPDTFERLLSSDRATPLGRGKSIMTRIEKGLAQVQQSLGDQIKKGTVIPPGVELKKGEESAEWALVVDESKPPILLTQLLHSGFNLITDELVRLVKDVLGNEELAEDLYFYARAPLHNKMKAAVKIPQYDPETEYGAAVYQAHAGSVTAPPPGKDLESQVAQTFLTRLRELNKLGQATDNRALEMSYGDLHGGNVMVRENGELVAADVGLFLVDRDTHTGALVPKGISEGKIFKRMSQLAGIILK